MDFKTNVNYDFVTKMIKKWVVTKWGVDELAKASHISLSGLGFKSHSPHLGEGITPKEYPRPEISLSPLCGLGYSGSKSWTTVKRGPTTYLAKKKKKFNVNHVQMEIL